MLVMEPCDPHTENDIRSEVVDDAMAEIYRGMNGAQRLKIASDMYVSARRMLLSHLRVEYPDWGRAAHGPRGRAEALAWRRLN